MDVYGWMIVFFTTLTSVTFTGASDHKCTFTKAKTITKFEQVYKPCKLSYRARCTWFSLDYCTFYHEQYCNKNYNTTETVYVQVVECCNNYVLAPNGTCVAKAQVENDDWYIRQQNSTTTEIPIQINPIDTGPVRNPVKDYSSDGASVDPSKVTKVQNKDNSMTLSHGAYAGIGCALLFLGIIAVLVFIGVRKRRRRFAARKSNEQRVPIHLAPEEVSET